MRGNSSKALSVLILIVHKLENKAVFFFFFFEGGGAENLDWKKGHITVAWGRRKGWSTRQTGRAIVILIAFISQDHGRCRLGQFSSLLLFCSFFFYELSLSTLGHPWLLLATLLILISSYARLVVMGNGVGLGI